MPHKKGHKGPKRKKFKRENVISGDTLFTAQDTTVTDYWRDRGKSAITMDIPRTRLQKIYTGMKKGGGKTKAHWWSPKYKEVFKEPTIKASYPTPNYPDSVKIGGRGINFKKGGVVKGNRDAFTQQYD